MFEEKMSGKSQQIPKPQIQQPADDEALSSMANRAIDEYTAKAKEPRHTYGHGIPKNSGLLNG